MGSIVVDLHVKKWALFKTLDQSAANGWSEEHAESEVTVMTPSQLL